MVGLVLLLLALAWLFRPLPADTLALAPVASTRFVDRHGTLLADEAGPLGTRARAVALTEVAPTLPAALVAVEDQRFFAHGGVDSLAVARAAWHNLRAGRVVGGGSTLSQQLARLLCTEAALLAGEPLPQRGLVQKLVELRLALRLERTFSKTELLEAFLNRAPFVGGTVGVAAGAERLFGVAPSALSTAQSALLAAVLKAPGDLDPRRNPEGAKARRDRVLALMAAQGKLSAVQRDHARAEPLVLSDTVPERTSGHAIDLAKAALGMSQRDHAQHEAVADAIPEPADPSVHTVHLTIDARLEAEISAIVREEIARLYGRGARSAAVVVLDNPTGELRAVVGSAFYDNPVWGQFNAATAVRQPGSALKPFLYAQALSQGMTAATLAADIERPYPDTHGIYQPENYDGRHHGPVRFREALAQSLNVAAVDVLFRTGLTPVFGLLSRLGLSTLDRRPEYFGLGLALGSGGVRLVDLTAAYATLGRGGAHLPWRILPGATPTPVQALEPRVAYLITDILSDPTARIPQFGERSRLRTPYFTAVKTGTSKGYRDNWTLGFTDTTTVGVWVGDPSGVPMRGVSGVDGAGVIWRRVMDLSSDGRSRRPDPPPGLVSSRICATSGLLAGADCPGGRDEWFVDGSAPSDTCTWHRHADVDPRNGRLVPESCTVPREGRLVTIYPSPFSAWAEREGVGIGAAPTPSCPSSAPTVTSLALLSPAPREHIRLDPDAPRDRQALKLAAQIDAEPGAEVSFVVDGEVVGVVGEPYVLRWPLRPGVHRIQARAHPAGPASAEHTVTVY